MVAGKREGKTTVEKFPGIIFRLPRLAGTRGENPDSSTCTRGFL